MNKNMMMLTVPMLFAFLITAAFGLRESARAQGNSTLAKRPESTFACNRSQTVRTLPARNFSSLPESVVVRKTSSEGSDGISEVTY